MEINLALDAASEVELRSVARAMASAGTTFLAEMDRSRCWWWPTEGGVGAGDETNCGVPPCIGETGIEGGGIELRCSQRVYLQRG